MRTLFIRSGSFLSEVNMLSGNIKRLLNQQDAQKIAEQYNQQLLDDLSKLYDIYFYRVTLFYDLKISSK